MALKKESSREEPLEKRMHELEERLEHMGKTLEEKGEVLGEHIEAKAKEIQKRISKGHDSGNNLFWGFLFVIIGLLWLGNNLGWFFYYIPVIPVAMIGAGIFLILKHTVFDESRKNHGEQS